MKVRVLDAMMIGGKPQPEGAIIDLPDAFAAEQITKGRVAEAPPEPEAKPKPKPEPEPPRPEPAHRRGSRR